ncbi:hypothetical protein JCM1841_003116 [Sporobolomyces salmonicolor]
MQHTIAPAKNLPAMLEELADGHIWQKVKEHVLGRLCESDLIFVIELDAADLLAGKVRGETLSNYYVTARCVSLPGYLHSTTRFTWLWLNAGPMKPSNWVSVLAPVVKQAVAGIKGQKAFVHMYGRDEVHSWVVLVDADTIEVMLMGTNTSQLKTGISRQPPLFKLPLFLDLDPFNFTLESLHHNYQNIMKDIVNCLYSATLAISNYNKTTLYGEILTFLSIYLSHHGHPEVVPSLVTVAFLFPIDLILNQMCPFFLQLSPPSSTVIGMKQIQMGMGVHFCTPEDGELKRPEQEKREKTLLVIE